MRKTLVVSFLLVLAAALANEANAIEPPTVSWTVTKHSSLTAAEYNNTIFDAVVDSSNELIEYLDIDCIASSVYLDVACALLFQRSGDVGTFSDSGLDVIDNAVEVAQVLDIATHRIKVVEQVNFCSEYNEGIIGCAPHNSDTLVIEYDALAFAYIHEYAHNEDLDHRNDCDWNIMNQYADVGGEGEHHTINEGECEAMGGFGFTGIHVGEESIYDGSGGPLEWLAEPYFLYTYLSPPAGQTLTVEPGVTIQVMYGSSFRPFSSSGSIVMRPGGTGEPVQLYSNCSGEHPCF
jgi:hypothetical protein